jgi:hypothetical protein
MQDHEDEAGSTDQSVEYAYEDGSGGSDLDANFLKSKSGDTIQIN